MGRHSYTIGNDMRVTVKTSLWVSVGLLVASEVPDNQRFVSRSREKHVRAVSKLDLHARGL
jgi:hypothetical protein